MTKERLIQPSDPEREPKTHAAIKGDQQHPREQPYKETYGKTDADPRGQGKPSDATRKPAGARK